MKWFLPITESSERFDGYAELLQVAIATARRHTSLSPHVLYTGGPNSLTRWLESMDVPIIPYRSSFTSALEETEARSDRSDIVRLGSAMLVSLDVPRVTRAEGVTDEFALITDVDIMFTGDPVPVLDAARPRFLAFCPETLPSAHVPPDRVNGGVILMNLPRMRRCEAALHRFVVRHLDRLAERAWDQQAYQEYFTWGHRRLARAPLARVGLTKPRLWDFLPAELNWRPFWGTNPDATIVHFHGPKPQDRSRYEAGEHAGHTGWAWPTLERDYATEGYFSYSRQWDQEFADLSASSLHRSAVR
jgi:hypothetical protein